MNFSVGLTVLALIAVAAAESGYYVPRSFYTINQNGDLSRLSLISPQNQERLLHRLRRQTGGSFSSISSSSTSQSTNTGNDGVTYFTQTAHHSVGGSPNYQSAYGGQSGAAPELFDRFGPDGSSGNNGVGGGTGYSQFSHVSGAYNHGTGQTTIFSNSNQPRNY